MLKRMIYSCTPWRTYPTFKVTFGNNIIKLTLEEEYLKISNKRIYYENILKFGYKKTYFYFFINKRTYFILKTKKSRQISQIIYERCIFLLNRDYLNSESDTEYETDSSFSENFSPDHEDRPPDYSSSEEDNNLAESYLDNPLYPRAILEN